jgi:hypothetical protein
MFLKIAIFLQFSFAILIGQDLTNGLVASYPFSGNTNDESGNENHGLICGNPILTEDRFYNPNSAYSFDGIDDYIEIADNPILNLTTDWSLCGWYKPAIDANERNTIMGRGEDIYDIHQDWVRYDTEINKFWHVYEYTNNVGPSAYSENDYLNRDTWYFVVSTRASDGTYNLYVNAELQSTMYFQYPTGSINANTYIGSHFNDSQGMVNYAKGVIDDIKFYNRALTLEEVKLLYYEVNGSCEKPFMTEFEPDINTLALWHLNEGTGDQFFDVSPNGNNGTLVNAVWTDDGKFGKGVYFDGYGDYLILPVSSSLEDIQDQVTIETWFKLEEYPPDQPSDVYYQCLWRYASPDYIVSSHTQLEPVDDHYVLKAQYNSNYQYSPYGIGGRALVSDPIYPNKWYHVAHTYNRNIVKLFIDGILVDYLFSDNIIDFPAGYIWFGQNGVAYHPANFKGVMDEVRVSNIARLYENICQNEPPVAICQSPTIDVGESCFVEVNAAQFDNGSYDPDGELINFSVEPTGPYPLGTTTVEFTVTDENGLSSTCETAVYVTGGAGDISGTISSNGVPIEGVLVKLLDNFDPTIIISETVTTEIGEYLFENVSPDTFQVMVIEPLGYIANQNFVQSILYCGNLNIIDIVFERVITVNDARGKGFWKHQFDVFVKDKGEAEETVESLNNFITEVHSRYTFLLPIFDGMTEFVDWQSVLSVNGNAGMETKAISHLAALVLNIMSQKIAQYEIVTEDGFTAGDVLTYVSELLPHWDTDPLNDELAKNLAEWVSTQQMIEAGLVHPSRVILYKDRIGEPSETENTIPCSYSLYQNYPNPFNPVTTITYDLPDAASVEISVFNIQGRIIKTLVNDFRTAGRHHVVFDASGLASGIYYYEMKTNSFNSVKKLIFTK